MVGWLLGWYLIYRASGYPREEDGAYIQMRLSYNLVADLFPSFVQWTDTHLTGALGLIRVLVYKVRQSILFPLFVQQRVLAMIMLMLRWPTMVAGLCWWQNYIVRSGEESQCQAILWYVLATIPCQYLHSCGKYLFVWFIIYLSLNIRCPSGHS